MSCPALPSRRPFGFALSPVVSRLFTPADFGVFGAFGAITGVAVAVATLDYSQAAMLPKDREDAGRVFLLSCVSVLATTLVCAGVCLSSCRTGCWRC